MKTGPPELWRRFFRWFCHPKLRDSIEGDLIELYNERRKKGKLLADFRFMADVLQLFRPSMIRPAEGYQGLNSYGMYKSYLKVGWRNLRRQGGYSVIKIGGLALGIASAILIGLFILDELKFDRHYSERLYRVVGVFRSNGRLNQNVSFPAPFARALKADYPEVEQAGRLNKIELFGAGSNEIRRADQTENTHEDGFVFMDQELLDMLQVKMVYGSRPHALREPGSIVLTRRKAEKYFPNEDPIGKLMVINNDDKRPLKVGGVIENLYTDSHLQYDFLITMAERSFWEGEQDSWRASNYHSYILVREGTDIPSLEQKITKGVIEKYVIPTMLEDGAVNVEEVVKNASLLLQPARDIYLHSADIEDGIQHGDYRFIWLFAAIAAFIVAIASINFVNLSTAKSANRAREVGLRKVVGSYRSNLISQFLSESVLFSVLASVIGILLAWLALPFFNQLAQKTLIFPWTDWRLVPVFLTVATGVGILAGLYPAFYLSSFLPARVLKGNLVTGSRNASTRSVLVVFQFITSIVLIVGTLVIHRQMDYILSRKAGFDKEQVILLEGANTLGDKNISFKEEMKRIPGVSSVALTSYLPIRGTKRNGNTFWLEGTVKTEPGVVGQKWRVDHDFVKTMGMKIAEGRDFDIRMATDSQAMIINQAMVHEMNLKQPVGQRITNGSEVYSVIGVVEDFNYETVRSNIYPLCLIVGDRQQKMVAAKFSTNDPASLVASVSKLWSSFAPQQPLRYTFLDASYARMYDDVQRMGRIFLSFAVLAIAVACLGLFALSAFMAEQRSKEIGVRRVLGASVDQILTLLTTNFIKLVLVSLLVAVPLSFYLMRLWLQDFVYRIELTWDIFVISGVLAVFIAVFTVSFQSLRAALANPVNSLRSE